LKQFLKKTISLMSAQAESKKQSFGLLQEETAKIPELDSLAKTIRKVITEDGKIREDLPELKAVREKMRTINKQIQTIANSYFKKAETAHYWQDVVPVQREGRVVLPLKANFRGKVKGIIHEVSSTGATLFIEPLDIVDKNNALIEQQNKFRQIVHQILQETTRELQKEVDAIESLTATVGFLDSLYARARYSSIHQCTRAELTGDELEMKQARHPLLGKEAVPIDISIPTDARALIISGPNTGGKTVALKTVGTLVLMNQHGMDVPVEEGSRFPVYDGVYVDIGDEQSIDQSLSTFSGHMQQIAEIVERSTADSLVLLDEIGSGTDVTEGSSIAMALLDYFIARNCTVMATTHQGILKNYGFSREKIENASVDFDEKTLTPTYRIIQGIPGESHAIEIARWHGIPDDILEKARGYRSGHETDISQIIREMSRKQKQLRDKEEQLRLYEETLRAQKQETEETRRKIAEKEAVLRREEVRDLRSFLRESRKTLENLVRELREQEVTKQETKKAKEFIRSLEEKTEEEEEKVDTLEEQIHTEPEKTREEYQQPAAIEPGMEVFISPSQKRGTVLRKSKKDEWVVTTNSMKIHVSEENLKPVASKKNRKESVDISVPEMETKPDYEVDVRGKRLEEALQIVKNQIDSAVVSGLTEFHIIHGKGQGILQQGIHDYLAQSREVADYSFSHPSQGGYGKTIVKLATR
jgi:DNA mismatch repair protein MutS2